MWDVGKRGLAYRCLYMCLRVLAVQNHSHRRTRIHPLSHQVSGGACAGYTFVGRSADSVSVRQDATGEVVEYNVLAVNAFSSKRKCMSVVVKRPDGRKVLLMKGADNVVSEREMGRTVWMNIQ